MRSFNPTTVEPLWDARQLAHWLGIHRTRLYHLVRTRRIPHLRVGRVLRFDPVAIASWCKEGGWVAPSIRKEPAREARSQ
jgi:excisionase family DNA binding protein